MGAEATIEFTEDIVCGVGVEVGKEDAFVVPNSASVRYSEIRTRKGFFQH